MTGLFDLPVEVLELIAYYATSPRKGWTAASAAGGGHDELALRSIHPRLYRIFTVAYFKHSTIVLNPRDTAAVSRLSSFCKSQDVGHHLHDLAVHAPNFLPRVHELNAQIYDTLLLFDRLYKLELSLDGHFIRMDAFPKLPNLKHLTLQGESLFSELRALPDRTPALVSLEILSPAISGSPASSMRSSNLNTDDTLAADPVTAYYQLPPSSSSPANQSSSHHHDDDDDHLPSSASSFEISKHDMPEHLTHLHISNVNSPSIQTLLLDLPFKPVHFSFSLLHNYDLAELAILLCRDSFCQRTVSIRMVTSKLVTPARLHTFKETMKHNLALKPVRISWEAD